MGQIVEVWLLFIKHLFEKIGGIAKNTGLLVVTRVQLWSHDVSRLFGGAEGQAIVLGGGGWEEIYGFMPGICISCWAA